ncbi:ABC transporter substrate-binding protein [Deinococcus radiopugnans]|uniref:ABC transporter substrate-binding protein n=1 Tax=Deinococcus radiopugnans ATCC 19172 TaxID=585398 RepID=A0A5C4YA96_9DEIO|nr:ABC transporter substrate-binding protein [Deinococcus radiopugnans]MBB6015408.1 peptide/nickel transport system substrate-binding protein [Deinococcus radiopugnans ATCC 19172]TNM72905.1 ABC transporter substrate-binding protein [Deinococcus radiopugnans ATCC 19172]
MKRALSILTLALLPTATAATPSNALVIQTATDIPTLDPVMTYDTGSGQYVENIYETLYQYKGSSVKDLQPLLATGHKASNGGKTHTFDLRKNVKFHSGNPFTCADAEYTFRRALVVNAAESWTWFLSEPLLGTPDNALNDKSITWARITKAVACNTQNQLVFNLAAVDPAFLAKLVFVGASIVDRQHAIKIGEWDGTEKTWKSWVGKNLNDSALSKNPSGTGAYTLVKRDANNTVLRAFPGYWGGAPALQNVIVQRVVEQATRLEALKRGDADIVETGPRPVLAQLRGQPGLRIIDDLPNNTASVIFMNEKISDARALGSGKLDGQGIPADFFSDVNVRRAFSYAMDYGRYIKEVQLGQGMQRTMALPDSFPGYDPKVKKYAFDPKKAEQYFKRAFGGQLWKNGFTFTAHYRAGAVAQQTLMELLKQAVESINPRFKVNVEGKQWSEMLRDSKDGREAMILIAWVPDYADPDNFINTFYSSQGFYSPRLNFKDATIDAWVRQARSTTDSAKRDRLYSLIGNRAFEQAPFLLMPAGIGFTVVRDNLRGVSAEQFNPMLSFSYTGTYWRELSKK